MIAWREVVDVIGARVLLQLDLAAMHRPQAMLLLLLARWSEVFKRFLCRYVGSLLLGKLVNLCVIHSVIT